jgi:hypothetical protein
MAPSEHFAASVIAARTPERRGCNDIGQSKMSAGSGPAVSYPFCYLIATSYELLHHANCLIMHANCFIKTYLHLSASPLRDYTDMRDYPDLPVPGLAILLTRSCTSLPRSPSLHALDMTLQHDRTSCICFQSFRSRWLVCAYSCLPSPGQWPSINQGNGLPSPRKDNQRKHYSGTVVNIEPRPRVF